MKREPWFKIRTELGPRRAALLTLVSFLLPLGIWCFVSYVPLIWHPDVKLQVSADRDGVTTVYTAGDHVSKGFFPEFQEAIRQENEAVRALLEDEAAEGNPAVRRQNQKLLRHIGPLAVEHGWIAEEEKNDDARLYEVWGGLATGERVATSPSLSEENLGIIRANWERLAANSPTFDFKALPDKPLLKLVPQGRPANPVFLPEPHEVLLTGYQDFTAPRSGDAPTMIERLGQSLRIVFLGFLLSCAIGVPLGVLCGTYDFVSKLFEPFIDFFRYMPAPAFSTLLVAVFLANDAPKVALIFIGTFFQMVLVTSKTTRQLDTALLEAAQTLGASPHRLVSKVVIPGILPNLYNDLRILLGWSWTWLVIAELIGVKSGLTEFIETQGRWRNFDSVYPVIIMIGLIGFFTDQLLAWLRGILFPYLGDGPSKPGIWGSFMKLLTSNRVAATPRESARAATAQAEPQSPAA